MAKNSFIKLSQSFCIAVIMLTFPLYSPGEEIRFELEVEHPREVLPWMPIEIKSITTYRGDKNILFPQGAGGYMGGVSIIKIFDLDSNFVYHGSFSSGSGACDETGDIVNIDTFYPPVEMKPGATSIVFQKMNYRHPFSKSIYDSHEPIFSISGEYKISFQGSIAYYPSGKEEAMPTYSYFNSEPSIITVIDPGEYRDALQAVKQLTYAKYFLEPKDLIYLVNTEKIKDLNAWDKELAQFLAKCGDSPWAPFAWHARSIIARNRGNNQLQIEYAGHAAATAQKFGINSTRQQALELQAQGLARADKSRTADEFQKKQAEAARREEERLQQIKESQAEAERAKKELLEKAEAGDIRDQNWLMATIAWDDFDKAEKWGERIAREHGAIGLAMFGYLYLELAEESKRDPEKALTLFRKSADGGSTLGMYYLGRCYLEGKGVAKDAAKAIEWFRKAADLGDISSQFRLIHCYRDGIGVPKDDAKADEWQRKYDETLKARAAAREAAQKAQE